MVNALANPQSSLSYRKLRAPRQHGQSLQIPLLSECDLDVDIQQRLSRTRKSVSDLSAVSKLGRQEIIELARQFTARYRSIDHVQTPTNRVIMSGHQPTLFHPGVWFKNYALSKLGQQLAATPINLIIDNDICGVSSIKIPHLDSTTAQIRWAPLDQAGDNIPYEVRKIEDRRTFCRFAESVRQQIAPFVDQPIVSELWKHVRPDDHQNLLGQTVATARHALEASLGLNTLEVPLSQIAQTMAFARFAQEFFLRVDAFQTIYNTRLAGYRQLHKIRSRSHPVPELATRDGWVETPFWVWQNDHPIRRRLFVKHNKEAIELSDLARVSTRLNRRDFAEQFSQLGTRNVIIRPRALITTMFSRLLASDLFLHGIGGAKYDQLTDAIAADFFGVQLPAFVTLTATMKLPTNAPEVTAAEIAGHRSLLRDLRFHPEAHLEQNSQQVEEIVASKASWIAQQPPRGRRLERHRAIEACNLRLQPFVQKQRELLEGNLSNLQAQLRNSQILGSREFSFCLFPQSLTDELESLTVPQAN